MTNGTGKHKGDPKKAAKKRKQPAGRKTGTKRWVEQAVRAHGAR